MGPPQLIRTDRHWALNVGINFWTPEEFFLGETGREKIHPWSPSQFLAEPDNLTSLTIPFATKEEQEIVVFVGSPGAGKSTFFRKYLEPKGYGRVNQDLLKTRGKCISRAREMLEGGMSVAIGPTIFRLPQQFSLADILRADNTNADVKTRAIWIELANKSNIKARCVYFTTPADICQHNDAVRAFAGIEVRGPTVPMYRGSCRFRPPHFALIIKLLHFHPIGQFLLPV